MNVFSLQLTTSNAAFTDNIQAETARILQDLASRLGSGQIDHQDGILFDLNGNNVGQWRFMEK